MGTVGNVINDPAGLEFDAAIPCNLLTGFFPVVQKNLRKTVLETWVLPDTWLSVFSSAREETSLVAPNDWRRIPV
jgi:hypothetical protein